MVLALVCAGCVTSYGYQTKETLARIEADPSPHLGELHAFQGRVIGARKHGSTWTVQILTKDYYATAHEPAGPSLIGLFDHEGAKFARGDHVALLGYMGNPVAGRNAFGGATDSMTMRVVAARNETVGYAWWLNDADDLHTQWRDGTLFSSR